MEIREELKFKQGKVADGRLLICYGHIDFGKIVLISQAKWVFQKVVKTTNGLPFGNEQ